MTLHAQHIEPVNVSKLVEEYVREELFDAEKYDNRTPLDESGIWSLHRLAGEIFALGYAVGAEVAEDQGRYARGRERDRRELAEHQAKIAAMTPDAPA